MHTVPIPLPSNKLTCGDCQFNEDAQDVEASRECRAFGLPLKKAHSSMFRCKPCLQAELALQRQNEVVAAAVAYKECKSEDGVVIGQTLNRLFKAIDDLKGT